MPEPLFEPLYRETATMNWQPSDVIRSRGRQRAYRQRAAAVASAAVAVVLVAAGAAVLAWRPTAVPAPPGGPTTSAAPSTSITASSSPSASAAPTSSPPDATPSPALQSVPDSAMLQTVDTGITSMQDEPRGAEDWPVSWVLGYCPTRVTNLFAHDPTADRQRLFTASADRSVLQRVRAYAAGEAEATLAALRSAVAECPRFDFQGTVTVTILARDFTGDESILVETNNPSGRRIHAIVRVGNFLSEILAQPADRATSDALARKAARRMCPVADRC